MLVGGLAVGAWGHVRGTKDIDIVPDPERENLSRLLDALADRLRDRDDLERLREARGESR